MPREETNPNPNPNPTPTPNPNADATPPQVHEMYAGKIIGRAGQVVKA